MQFSRPVPEERVASPRAQMTATKSPKPQRRRLQATARSLMTRIFAKSGITRSRKKNW
jgi:hypothetical protein